MQNLADHAAKGGKQNAQGAALLQGHLHGLRDTQADAGGGLGHVAAEGDGQLAGLDVLHRDGAALGAGHRLLGNKQDVAGLHLLLGIAAHYVLHLVRLGDQVGFDGDTLVVHPVHGADQLLTRVGAVNGLFAHILQLLSGGDPRSASKIVPRFLSHYSTESGGIP